VVFYAQRCKSAGLKAKSRRRRLVAFWVGWIYLVMPSMRNIPISSVSPKGRISALKDTPFPFQTVLPSLFDCHHRRYGTNGSCDPYLSKGPRNLSPRLRKRNSLRRVGVRDEPQQLWFDMAICWGSQAHPNLRANRSELRQRNS